MIDRQKFAVLRAARRIWAVGAIHAEVERLDRVHARIWPRIEAGDRIVYLGNIIGRGPATRRTLDRLLNFRIHVLARPGSDVGDLVYLRGSQEEMWQKLLQLQFAADPRGVLEWMLGNGVAPVLEAYAVRVQDALGAAAGGTPALTRWTGHLRQAIRARPGHYEIMGVLRRAAYTDERSVLFVNAGIDPSRPLEAQSDSFWWSGGQFESISEPYGTFRRIVRGFDPGHAGFAVTDHTTTLDGGCGFGGPLIAACLTPEGEIIEVVEG